MGDGDTSVGWHRDPAGHAGDDLEGYPGLKKGERLLAAAPKDVRVAAFEAHGCLVRSPEVHQERVDLRLLHRPFVTRLLTDVMELRLRVRVPQQAAWREPVVDDGVGLLQAPETFEGEEAGVTRPGADEVDQKPPPGAGRRNERQLKPPSSFRNSDISSSMTSYPLSAILSLVLWYPAGTRTQPLRQIQFAAYSSSGGTTILSKSSNSTF